MTPTRCCLLLALITCLGWQDARSQADISSDIDAVRLNRNMPGMSAVALKGGRIVAQGAAGYRRQGDPTPLLVTDPINIGSCTNWDTRVRDIFTNYPTFNTNFHGATLEQFLAHRTGVQSSDVFSVNHWNQFAQQQGTETELRRWVSETVLKDAPQVPPGDYLYANQGYAVAATMMEIASGKSWEDLVRTEIFDPLRIKSGSFGLVYDGALPPKAPVGHYLEASKTNSVPYSPLSTTGQLLQEAAFGPGGMIGCTLPDWAKFLHVQATSDINGYLSSATASKLQRPFMGLTGSEGYGLGVWAVNRSFALPGQALCHWGRIWGMNAVFWMAPATDFLVVVFANSSSDADSRTTDALDEVASLLVSRYSGTTVNGPLIELPVALPLRHSTNSVAFEFLSIPGVPYYAESSTNLTTWVPANGAVSQTATNLQTTIIDTNPGFKKFYRVKAAP